MQPHAHVAEKIYNGLRDRYYHYQNEAFEIAKYMKTDLVLELHGLIDKFWPVRSSVLSDDGLVLIFLSLFLILTWVTVSRIQIILRARNCKVTSSWNEGKIPCVGEVGVLKISFFLTGELLQFLRPSNPESISKLLRSVTVKVVLGHEEIIVEKSASDREQAIFLKFQINRSGKYGINIYYDGFPVCGSPFTAIVDPDEMDALKTTFDWISPIVLTQGKMSTLEFMPNDQYGNRCAVRADNLNRFGFAIHQIPGVRAPNPMTTFTDIKSSFSIRGDLRCTDKNVGILNLHLKPEVVDVFSGRVLYNGITLREFDIISISTQEEIVVLEKEYQERDFDSAHCADFKATMANGKDVVVELSPRFFYLKDLPFDGILASRIATFRVCKQTVVKIESVFEKDGLEMYNIKIADQVQNQTQILEMTAVDARIFVVLISRFCSNGDNDFLSLETKRMQLYNQLRDINPERPRIKYKILKIHRDELIQSTLDETRHFTREDWGKPFVVSFYGEPVKTEGLAWLDWSESLLDSLFENNSHGMFCSFGSSGLLHPNPNRNARWTSEHYELAGKIVGKYLIETALDTDGNMKYYANARFSRSFLAQLLSLKPTYKHMELDDPEIYESTIQPILNGNVDGMNLTFTGPVYDTYGNMITRELISNGSATFVTNDNKLIYVNALANLRLAANIQEEMEAFVSGLTIIIPNDLLMAFDEHELELVLCGSSAFSLRDIQLNHVTSGTSWNPYIGRILQWLWDSLQKMSPLDIGRFLQFVTGSSRLPPGGLAELKPRLKISVSCLFGRLPTSNKALHHLCLTDHPTCEEFTKALIAAIRGIGEKTDVPVIKSFHCSSAH